MSTGEAADDKTGCSIDAGLEEHPPLELERLRLLTLTSSEFLQLVLPLRLQLE